MKGYIVNIEDKTQRNEYFREVLFTAPNSQLVVMSLKPKEEIGEETHDVDQFLRIEVGVGKVILDGEEFEITDGEVDELTVTIKRVTDEITSLSFWDTKCDDKDCEYCAYRKLLV